MYVGMYPGTVRGQAIHNYPPTPQYPDYGGYPGADTIAPSSGSSAWFSHYGAPREDWGPSPYSGPTPINPSPVGYSPISDYPTPGSGLSAGHPPQVSPGGAEGPRRHHYDWMRKPPATTQAISAGGKTRTKDKYRVVYTDHQRLELEKEFHYSRYITIRRKSELAINLGLSERQVKIWFQNRRAKERKINKKKFQQTQSGQHGHDGLSPLPMGHMMPMPGTDVGPLTSPVSQ